MSKAAELAALIGSQTALSHRNLIINGAMEVDQRNTTTTATSGGIYSLDRFQVLDGGDGGFDVSQSTTAPAGFINSLKVDVTSADSSIAADAYKLMYYNMEGLDTVRLNLGTSNAVKATISFYVRSNVTGNHSFALRNGAANRAYAALYNISSANTWERKSITVQLDTAGTWTTTTALGLTLIFSFATGSNFVVSSNEAWESANKVSADGAVNVFSSASNEWYITGLQMEVGEQATAFEHRSFAHELQKCKRYFQTYNEPPARGATSGGSTDRMAFMLPVTMRAAPSVTFSGTLNWYDGAAVGTITSFSATYTEPHSVEFDATFASGSSSAGRGMVIYNASADGTLNMDAEL